MVVDLVGDFVFIFSEETDEGCELACIFENRGNVDRTSRAWSWSRGSCSMGLESEEEEKRESRERECVRCHCSGEVVEMHVEEMGFLWDKN